MEVLVVVGIIAVLASILIPSLSRVRNQSRQIECLNNMRQIALAMVAFSKDHDDHFPRPALYTPRDANDWVHWQEGTKYPDALPSLNKSAVVPYLGGQFNPNVFTCPVDIIESHAQSFPGAPVYPYSYSINRAISRSSAVPGTQTMTTLQVVSPSTKILLIDETSETVSDGSWDQVEETVNTTIPPTKYNVLSSRHDKTVKSPANQQRIGSGNVAFCDAHAEPIPRNDMYQPIFTNPVLRSTADTLKLQ